MNQKNDQKLIENKKPKKNILVLLLVIIIVFLLSLVILSVYFWIDIQKNYTTNQKYIEEFKIEFEDKFNKNYSLVNSNQVEKYDNLSKSVMELSDRIFYFEEKINKNEQDNAEILSYLSNLNQKFEGINLQLKRKLQTDNQSKIINQTKNILIKNNFDLNSMIQKLNDEFRENIPWNQTLIEINKSDYKEFLKEFSSDLQILQKYSFSPPPTLNILKNNFKLLIPSILEFLPNDDENFINVNLNWIIKSIKLRRAGVTEGKSPSDLISNIEYYLAKNNLKGVIENFKNLPDEMQKPALEWLNNLKSRSEINSAVNNILENYGNYIK